LDLPPADANAGLWWAKLCNQWKADWSGLIEPDKQSGAGGGKRDWIKTLAGKEVGRQADLTDAVRRRDDLVRELSGRSYNLSLCSRLVTGTGYEHPVENGMLFHHTLGVPYLPGSGIKGLVRAWVEQVLLIQGDATDWQDALPEGKELDAAEQRRAVDRIFGPRNEIGRSVGSVVFLDALPTAPVRLVAEVMTPHYGPWYQAKLGDELTRAPPADWYGPNPIPFLAVGENQLFTFAVLPNRHGSADAAQSTADFGAVERWLAQALEWLGVGAKTAVGFGRFSAGPLPAMGRSQSIHAPPDDGARRAV
jgi:CRISPR-associated protein Cmr6